MNADEWLEGNNRYLAASLQWLRSRLQAIVRDEAPAPATPSTTPSQSTTATPQPASAPSPKAPSLLDRMRGIAPRATPAGAAAPSTGTAVSAVVRRPEGDQPAVARHDAAQTDPPPALVVLARNLGLSDFERDTLLLCAAAELDPAMGALYSAAQGNAARNYPTFALALQAFADPSWDALSPHRPLRYLRLLEINQPGATPLTAAAMRADERVVNYIKGLNVVDERLTALLLDASPDEGPALAPSQQAVADGIVADLQASAADERLSIVELLGSDQGSKHDIATQACARMNRHLYRISIDALPGQKAELENIARLWLRETLMLPVALYVDAEELDGANPEQANALHWFLSRNLGLVLVGLREPPARPIEGSYSVEVRKPTVQEQFAAWSEMLRTAEASDAEANAAMLAGQFNLNLREIARAMSLATHSQVAASLVGNVWDACCSLTRPRLDLLAQRIEPKASWQDLVLPGDALALLHQIAAQVRGALPGIRALGLMRER